MQYDFLRPGPSSTIDEERKPDVDGKHGLGCFAGKGPHLDSALSLSRDYSS